MSKDTLPRSRLTRLAEIEAREKACTELPWVPRIKWCDHGVTNAVGMNLANVSFSADALFIAHARTDIPWLIEQVRELMDMYGKTHEWLCSEVCGTNHTDLCKRRVAYLEGVDR